MVFLDQRCGSWQVGADAHQGPVEFTILFPDGADPHVQAITVIGDFQTVLGSKAWEPDTGLAMTRRSGTDQGGAVWTARTPGPLPAGYHEYAYWLVFDDGTTRRAGDPCARYGGRRPQSAGIVVGGSHGNVVSPLERRLPWSDLVVYELMIDDFTADYRRGRAPVDAVVDRLDALVDLGFNAVEFMPWTAGRHSEFDWGYEPCQYFAVERRYTEDEGQPAEQLSRLKNLVSACHVRGLHVIMDGVFNHTSTEFPYAQLYRDPADCPLVGTFGGHFTGLQELDFARPTTTDFIVEACTYWIDEFGIDGIRFDAARYYVDPEPAGRGLGEIIRRVREHVIGADRTPFPLVLEYLDPGALGAAESLGADGYWDEALMHATNDALDAGRVGPRLLGALTPRAGLAPGRAPCVYLSNHDYSQVLGRAGRGRRDGGLEVWWRVQPFLIALYTGPGVPLVPNGQEIGEEHLLPSDEHGTRRRILSRPVRWAMATDRVGGTLGALHGRLAALRSQHPALRSAGMEPDRWEDWQTLLDPATGLGFDVERQLAIYRRWSTSTGGTGSVDEVVVVLNFADRWQEVEVPLRDGTWTDALAGFDGGDTFTVEARGPRTGVPVGGSWGRVLTR